MLKLLRKSIQGSDGITQFTLVIGHSESIIEESHIEDLIHFIKVDCKKVKKPKYSIVGDNPVTKGRLYVGSNDKEFGYKLAMKLSKLIEHKKSPCKLRFYVDKVETNDIVQFMNIEKNKIPYEKAKEIEARILNRSI